MGSCQGRQEVGSPRGVPGEGRHLSPLQRKAGLRRKGLATSATADQSCPSPHLSSSLSPKGAGWRWSPGWTETTLLVPK